LLLGRESLPVLRQWMPLLDGLAPLLILLNVAA